MQEYALCCVLCCSTGVWPGPKRRPLTGDRWEGRLVVLSLHPAPPLQGRNHPRALRLPGASHCPHRPVPEISRQGTYPTGAPTKVAQGDRSHEPTAMVLADAGRTTTEAPPRPPRPPHSALRPYPQHCIKWASRKSYPVPSKRPRHECCGHTSRAVPRTVLRGSTPLGSSPVLLAQAPC